MVLTLAEGEPFLCNIPSLIKVPFFFKKNNQKKHNLNPIAPPSSTVQTSINGPDGQFLLARAEPKEHRNVTNPT
jgi:hypothetical protein